MKDQTPEIDYENVIEEEKSKLKYPYDWHVLLNNCMRESVRQCLKIVFSDIKFPTDEEIDARFDQDFLMQKRDNKTAKLIRGEIKSSILNLETNQELLKKLGL